MHRIKQTLAAFFFLALITGPALAMTVQNVVELLNAGVGESVIEDQIAAESARFELTTDDILALKEAGASDDLIRTMIASAKSGTSTEKEDGTGRGGDYESDLEHQYRVSTALDFGLYYDPFGYYWYGWPHSFAYYYPFTWLDCGFYYAGWWNRHWWGWGPWASGTWNHYCSDWNWRSDGRRHSWSRDTRGPHRTQLPPGRQVAAAQPGRTEKPVRGANRSWDRGSSVRSQGGRTSSPEISRPRTPSSHDRPAGSGRPSTPSTPRSPRGGSGHGWRR